MTAKSDSDSSSSSSSSSSDEKESLGGHDIDKVVTTNDDSPTDGEFDYDRNTVAGNEEGYGTYGTVDGADDSCKAFLSRIPQMFNDESVKRILEEKFGDGCVLEASIASEKLEEDGHHGASQEKETSKEGVGREKSSGNEKEAKHRGFGFVTFASPAQYQAAIEAGSVRGSFKSTSKRKHTMYIRPVVREEENGYGDGAENVVGRDKNICFLWNKHRCPYGDGCKFVHEGEGGCVADAKKDGSHSKKKQKCFTFKKSGKCKHGDECQFSHDIVTKKEDGVKEDVKEDKTNDKKRDRSLKDCINWKNKGKCRKGDKCPFRHDESLRDKVIAKKKGKEESTSTKRSREDKNRQSLYIRVFGLNYDTTQYDIKQFFDHCGTIMEITFPLFEDSGRSKGYCGVLFQSPKAVEKAVELDGSELHGRWLRIQEGKMFLRKWEEVESDRKKGLDDARMKEEEGLVGEYGQKVKKRKKHGFKEE